MIHLSLRCPVNGLRVACKGIGAVVIFDCADGSYRQTASPGQHRHKLIEIAVSKFPHTLKAA